MVVVLHACVVGPLELHAVGFAGELARQGYTVHTMRQQLGLVAHLSRWMTGQQVDVADLSPLSLPEAATQQALAEAHPSTIFVVLAEDLLCQLLCASSAQQSKDLLRRAIR